MPNIKPAEFFKKLRDAIPQLERDIAAHVVAVEAENQFASHFRREGFEDKAFTAWQARDPKAKRNEGRSLLVDTGRLRRAATKGRVEGDAVRFTVPLVYANVHNSDNPAERRAGRGKGFTMPQRKFIGQSEALDRRIERKARQLLDQKLSNL